MATIEAALAGWKGRGSKRPFFIGIGGGSAAGKSTLAMMLAERLAPLQVEMIGQDHFFKQREDMPEYYSGIHGDYRPAYNEPDSFKQEEMFAYCREIADGDVVILEGILVLWFTELRELMDFKMYVDADADERIIRRIRRNMKRIDDYDPITEYYLESVRGQHHKYNAPTREYADLIISGGIAQTEERERIVNNTCAVLSDIGN